MDKRNLQSLAYAAATTGVAVVYLLACAGALLRLRR